MVSSNVKLHIVLLKVKSNRVKLPSSSQVLTCCPVRRAPGSKRIKQETLTLTRSLPSPKPTSFLVGYAYIHICLDAMPFPLLFLRPTILTGFPLYTQVYDALLL